MKSTAMQIIAFLVAYSLFVPSVFAVFRDVPLEHVHAEGIAYVQAQGIVEGYADGTFKPENTINRAEFTKMIVEARYNPSENGVGRCFTDVQDEWFAEYVCLAKDRKLIDGYADGTFKPGNRINVAEASKILAQAYGKHSQSMSNIWYEGSIVGLLQAGALPEDILDVGAFLTRGQMAEMLFRLESNITTKPIASYQQLLGKSAPEIQAFNIATGKDIDTSYELDDNERTLRRDKLGEVSYAVIVEDATETPYENEYWDNKEAGIYVDKVSGEPLYASVHKYDSQTGWPSFWRAIDDQFIVQKEDKKLFVTRVELRSKYGDSHLGHLFTDGPKEKTGLRHCINSAAMRFVPKETMEKEGYADYLHFFIE